MAVLGAIGLVWAVLPEAQPVILIVGALAYLILCGVGYVVQLRRHW